MITRILSLLLLVSCFAPNAGAQTTWTLRNEGGGSGELLWSVTDGNAGLVAVGNNGRILHAPDGVDWLPRLSAATGWLVAVTFGNGRYVIVGENGQIFSSTDGIGWTPAATTGTTARLNNVLYAQGRYVAVGEGGTIVVSTDANNWSAVSSGVSGWLHGLAFGAGRWLASGQAGTIVSSSDGLAWANRSIANYPRNIESLAFNESYSSTSLAGLTSYTFTSFVGVADLGTVLQLGLNEYFNTLGQLTSASLSFGSTGNITGTSVALRSISSWNKSFIIAGDGGQVFTGKSATGPWTRLNVGSSKLLNASGFGRDSLFLVGADETIYQSEQIFRSRLGNVATRGEAGAGDNVMIAGTVVEGTLPKQFLLRGVGPELKSRFGLQDALEDPVLRVYNRLGQLVTSIESWGSNPNPANLSAAAAAVGAFPLTAGSKDAALLITLSPGAYTFHLASKSGQPGVGLIEAYDLDAINGTSSRAINLSTRGRVGTGSKILIAGLVVQGPAARTILLRGVGPALASTFSMTGTLEDPQLTLYSNNGTIIATNDDWSTTTIVPGRDVTADDIRATSGVSGAFPFADGSKDAALLVTLAPGAYTIHLSGVNAGEGIALIEAYDVPTN